MVKIEEASIPLPTKIKKSVSSVATTVSETTFVIISASFAASVFSASLIARASDSALSFAAASFSFRRMASCSFIIRAASAA